MTNPRDERQVGGTYALTDEDHGIAVDDLGSKKKKARGASSPREAEPAASPAPTGLEGLPTLSTLPAPAPAGPSELDEIEKLVQRGDWPAVEKLLFADGQLDAKPPRHRLLWSIAAKETGVVRKGVSADAVAIASAAQLLSVPEASAIAMVLGKRLIRRRAMTQRPAPKPFISWLIVLGGLAVGAGIGIFLAR